MTKGYIGLDAGQVSVTVPLPTIQADNAFAFAFLYVENLMDSSPIFIGVVPTAKTTISFTVQLSSAPDTANYTLRWGIAA